MFAQNVAVRGELEKAGTKPLPQPWKTERKITAVSVRVNEI